MIGIDTNVLARYIVQDDPKQSAAATRCLERQCSRNDPGHVTLIVLCELVWVLRRAYQYKRNQVVEALRRIIEAAELEVEHREIADQAIADYGEGDADFADYVIARLNESAGAKHTVTFDRSAAAHPRFKLLG
ncbi:MAG: PIN domain-containing protein [Phycisphaeraceae bacterium]|nr:PIN domain-containing protein [Phycisphaeraceae bacterium]